MPGRFLLKGSVVKYTAKRAALAGAIAGCATLIFSLSRHGTDLTTLISLADVLQIGLMLSVSVSITVTAIFAYRSGLLLRKIDLARAEFLDASRTDALTGLLNRRGFGIVATDQLDATNQAGHSTALLMCDIDHFKSVNDKYGHEFGDAALMRIGRVLRDLGSEQDVLIGRVGGEEFAILMPNANWYSASRFADRIRQRCAEQTIATGSGAFSLTISVGFAVAQHGHLDQLLREADQALYAAKTAGRNRVAQYYQTQAATGT